MTAAIATIKNYTQRNHTRSASGFTLIELMVIIAIIAILAVLSTPVLRTMLLQQEFNGSVRDVLSALRQARLVAVEQNESVVFRVDTAAGTFQAFVDDGGNSVDGNLDGVLDDAQNWTLEQGSNERLIINGTVPNDVTITAANFGGNPVFRFDNKGFPMSEAVPMSLGVLTNGTITMTSNALGHNRQIDLFRSGHSRIQ